MATFGESFIPRNGIFSAMPTTAPWNGVLSPARMDIHLWSDLSDLDVSPLVRALSQDGVVNVTELAAIIYEQYASNWKRLWDALLIEYDILHPSATLMDRTLTTDRNDLETRALNKTDGSTTTRSASDSGQTVRTGGQTDTNVKVDNSKNDQTTSGSETTTESQRKNGVGAVGDTPVQNVTTTVTRSGETHDLTEGRTTDTDTLVYNDLKDSTSGSSTGTDTVSGTSTDSGTVANAGKTIETEHLDQKGASSLNSHQELIVEEINLRTGVGGNFLALIIQDVRHETCARVWRRKGVIDL